MLATGSYLFPLVPLKRKVDQLLKLVDLYRSLTLHYNIHYLFRLAAFFCHKTHYMAFDRLVDG